MIPTPGIPSKTDIPRLALFIGMLIPVNLPKAFNSNKHAAPGITDFKALMNGCLCFKIK